MAKDKIFYGWILVPVLGIIYLIDAGFPFIGASVMNTYMAESLHLGRGTLGLGFTVCGLLSGLISPIIGYSIGKKGIRLTLIFGCLLLIVGSFLMATVVSKGWHYIAVFGVIVGVGCGFGGLIPVQAGVTFWFRKKKALAMSIAVTIGSLGGLIAPPLLNKIISSVNGDWRVAWFFITGLLMLSFILMFFFVKNKPSDIGLLQDGVNEHDEPAPADGVKKAGAGKVFCSTEEWKAMDAIKTLTFWMLFISSLAFVGPMMIFIAHAVIYLRDMGHPAGISAMAMSYYMLFSLGGRMLGGVLADRFEPRYIWAVGLLLETVGILCFLDARSVSNIYLFSIFVGVGVGAASICWPTLIGNYFGSNSFAAIMGILFPIVQLFGASAPYLAGLVYDAQGSYYTVFVGSAALAFISSIIICFTKPPKSLTGGSQQAAVS